MIGLKPTRITVSSNGGMEFLVILSVSTSVMEPVRQSLSASCTGVPPRMVNNPINLLTCKV